MHDWWGIALLGPCGIAIIAGVFMSSKDKPPPIGPMTTSPAFKSVWWQTVVPIVISLAALWVAYDQGQQTRLHHRLSVKPEIQVSFYTNDEGAGWEMRNAGLGLLVLNGSKPHSIMKKCRIGAASEINYRYKSRICFRSPREPS